MGKLIILVIILSVILSSSCGYRPATQEEHDLMFEAINNSDADLCEKINPRAKIMKRGLFDYTTKTYDLRNHCIYEIAIEKKNPELCEELKLIEHEEEFLPAYKESCIKKANR